MSRELREGKRRAQGTPIKICKRVKKEKKKKIRVKEDGKVKKSNKIGRCKWEKAFNCHCHHVGERLK
jgi:hypothetical protein